MDTILFIYKKKDVKFPFVEAISQNTYMLVKIGMDVEPYRFCIQCMPHKKPKPEITAENGRTLEGWDWINPKYRKERREIRTQQKEWKEYETLMDTLMDRCKIHTEELIARMMKETVPYVDEYSGCYCVFEKSVRDVLFGDNPVGRVWQGMWRAKEFTFYTEQPWVQLIMPSAENYHFIVLGESPCVPNLLTQSADRMKSLRWIIDEDFAQAHDEELEDFAENFYQEQGLAVSIERVQGKNGFKKLQLTCKEPSNILDFTGEDKISIGEVAKGSIWLDMKSSEEKCRRFSQNGTAIQYFSLREKWRQTQKKSYRLDTLDKNEYNT
jgi:hypothetical protein